MLKIHYNNAIILGEADNSYVKELFWKELNETILFKYKLKNVREQGAMFEQCCLAKVLHVFILQFLAYMQALTKQHI